MTELQYWRNRCQIAEARIAAMEEEIRLMKPKLANSTLPFDSKFGEPISCSALTGSADFAPSIIAPHAMGDSESLTGYQ